METLVSLIRSENFEREVISENKPVLLLCMPWDGEFPKQLELIEEIARMHSQELKVGLLQEEFIESFRENYGVLGTPTFLILKEGKEKRRLLGHADQETLMELIQSCLTPEEDRSFPKSKMKF
jgi:thioredoxin-like negative regulator of GroEL